jgi:hypothetical protein
VETLSGVAHSLLDVKKFSIEITPSIVMAVGDHKEELSPY